MNHFWNVHEPIGLMQRARKSSEWSVVVSGLSVGAFVGVQYRCCMMSYCALCRQSTGDLSRDRMDGADVKAESLVVERQEQRRNLQICFLFGVCNMEQGVNVGTHESVADAYQDDQQELANNLNCSTLIRHFNP